MPTDLLKWKSTAFKFNFGVCYSVRWIRTNHGDLKFYIKLLSVFRTFEVRQRKITLLSKTNSISFRDTCKHLKDLSLYRFNRGKKLFISICLNKTNRVYNIPN